MNNSDYMQRCFELAMKGKGYVSPNPLVGSVIVHDDRIIGEGYHKMYGEPHAEVNAIESVENPELLKASTLYVNLEPCSHHGKTPPCADLIIKHGIPRVVICNTDPNPLVSGKGIEKLRNAGIDVETGLLKEDGEQLNRYFFTKQRLGRPYITLKWAQTADGFMGLTESSEAQSRQISSPESQIWVHQLRAEMDAILVGANTIIADNPALTTRLVPGPSPLRVVLDPTDVTPMESTVIQDNKPTLLLSKWNEHADGYEKIQSNSRDLLEQLLAELNNRNILSVFVEGGAETLKSFIDKGLWDEAYVLTEDIHWKNGVSAPVLEERIESEFELGSTKVEVFKKQ